MGKRRGGERGRGGKEEKIRKEGKIEGREEGWKSYRLKIYQEITFHYI